VSEGVKVGVMVGVSVTVGLGVKDGSKQIGAEFARSNGLRVFPYSS
jgi:hypothetical protein